jgi:alkylation response protein AidB-like acyl-CoA dehydrogenase
MATEVEVARLMQRRVAWLVANGQFPDTEGSMAKLFSSEAIERQAQDLVDLLGSDGIRSRDDENAPVDGAIEHALRTSLGTTIYAGTSEVQRTIIAQRALGLPRH